MIDSTDTPLKGLSQLSDYQSIKIINSVTYKTHQDACYAMRLLTDDKEFIDAIKESNYLASTRQLRTLFATLLMMNTMVKPDEVWRCTLKLLSDDILCKKRKEFNLPGKNEILIPNLT